MSLRLLTIGLSVFLLSEPSVAVAQQALLDGPAGRRVDILTGEPVRPRGERPRPQPEIYNAPHAPMRGPGHRGDGPPLEIYVVPQIGAQYGTQPAPNYGAQLRSQRSNEVKPQFGSQYRSPYGSNRGSPYGTQGGGYAR